MLLTCILQLAIYAAVILKKSLKPVNALNLHLAASYTLLRRATLKHVTSSKAHGVTSSTCAPATLKHVTSSKARGVTFEYVCAPRWAQCPVAGS